MKPIIIRAQVSTTGLQYSASTLTSSGDFLVNLHGLPPVKQLPPFDLEFTIRNEHALKIDITIELTITSGAGFLNDNPSFRGFLSIPATSFGNVRISNWAALDLLGKDILNDLPNPFFETLSTTSQFLQIRFRAKDASAVGRMIDILGGLILFPHFPPN